MMTQKHSERLCPDNFSSGKENTKGVREPTGRVLRSSAEVFHQMNSANTTLFVFIGILALFVLPSAQIACSSCSEIQNTYCPNCGSFSCSNINGDCSYTCGCNGGGGNNDCTSNQSDGKVQNDFQEKTPEWIVPVVCIILSAVILLISLAIKKCCLPPDPTSFRDFVSNAVQEKHEEANTSLFRFFISQHQLTACCKCCRANAAKEDHTAYIVILTLFEWAVALCFAVLLSSIDTGNKSKETYCSSSSGGTTTTTSTSESTTTTPGFDENIAIQIEVVALSWILGFAMDSFKDALAKWKPKSVGKNSFILMGITVALFAATMIGRTAISGSWDFGLYCIIWLYSMVIDLLMVTPFMIVIKWFLFRWFLIPFAVCCTCGFVQPTEKTPEVDLPQEQPPIQFTPQISATVATSQPSLPSYYVPPQQHRWYGSTQPQQSYYVYGGAPQHYQAPPQHMSYGYPTQYSYGHQQYNMPPNTN